MIENLEKDGLSWKSPGLFLEQVLENGSTYPGESLKNLEFKIFDSNSLILDKISTYQKRNNHLKGLSGCTVKWVLT